MSSPEHLNPSRIATSRARAETLGDRLLHAGAINVETRDWAEARRRRHAGGLTDILTRHGHIDEDTLRDARAALHGMRVTQPGDPHPDVSAIRRLGPAFCARHRIIPLVGAGAFVPVLCTDPDQFERLRSRIDDRIGAASYPLITTEAQLSDLLMRYAGPALADRAECRSPAAQSCRHMTPAPWRAVCLVAMILIAIALAPGSFVVIGCIAALGVAALNGLLLLYALFADLRRPSSARDGPALARLPVVSILVPLYREEDIAAILVDRIARLDYPRELLDICLLIEENDPITALTLARTELPPWVRVLRVAPGRVQTKPRAMNLALDFCRGAIIGIYDAEDAPAPDQIHRMVAQFARSGPNVAALQGRLAFYNARATWLTRCFFLEYATWFSLILPAIRRLGWAVPLGGTTVFLRRGPLEQVGGWDAFNVTEDADLGLRLARAGFRTDLLDSTTLEEATASPCAWIKQRSRWQKGYAITWAAHMRAPLSLWSDLGAWGFFGVQVLFLGSLLSTALAPFLWSFWLPMMGVAHPLFDVLSPTGVTCLISGMLFYLVLNAVAQARATTRLGRPSLIAALPWTQLYSPLATLALVKAAIELAWRPFFWDKTTHGVTAPDLC